MRISRESQINAMVAKPPISPSHTVEAATSRAPTKEEGPSPFARILSGVGNEMDRGEKLVTAALSSQRDMGAHELLALQAGVYRYSEAVDLAAKLVDRVSSGVKTIIQGQ